MNFFEHQANARRISMRLTLLFGLAVAGIVIAVNLAMLLVFGRNDGIAGLLAFTTLVTLLVIGGGSLFRIASLRGGGESVATQLGGVLVPENTTDPHLRRLRNVAEEIAIASGVPVPRLYVLENESAINAFAAGYSASDAAVAVTRGALDRLNRDELQGVIAHEFSHILNGDMRLNIRLIGVLFGILMLSLIGRKILQHGGARGRGMLAVLAVALTALLVGAVGLFFARLLKAGISRSRESLADASAVQFTRQTAGLAGALKKIAGVHEGSRLADRGDAEEVSHMLFGDGLGFSGLFATHPPLLERIRKLEPTFASSQLDALRTQWAVRPPNGLEEDVQLGLHAADADASAVAALPAPSSSIALTPPMVTAQVAHPDAGDYRRADAIAAHMPETLRALAQDRDSVEALLLGLLLSADARVLNLQRTEMVARLGEDGAARVVALREAHLAQLHPSFRLPLASLAFPALRRRPRPQLERFLETAFAIVNTDGQVSLFEYCFGRLLQVQVREAIDPARYAHFGRRHARDVRNEFATLLAVVAQSGNADPARAQHAYLAGLQRVLPRDHLPYAPPANGVLALDQVWEPLDALDPLAKELLVEALTAAISHDGRVTVAEAELLRTICASLHCPLPAMLEEPGANPSGPAT